MINTYKIKETMSNFGAIHRIDYMEGTLSCTCGYTETFAHKFDGGTDGDEVEAWVLDVAGWGETGCCPKCEAEANAEEAADRARQEYKDAIYD